MVGANIRAARKRAGLTQAEVADAAGVSQAAVSQLERGREAGVVGTLRRVADVLGITLAALVDPENAKPNGSKR